MIVGDISVARPTAQGVPPGTVLPAGPQGLTGPVGPQGPIGPRGASGANGVIQSFIRPDGVEVSKAKVSLDDIGALSKTGDASNLVTQAMTAAANARPLGEKIAETTVSFLDYMPRSTRAALLAGIGTNDDLTAALNAALADGHDLRMPSNLGQLRVTSPLMGTAAYQRIYWGKNTRVLYDPPTGTPIQPIVIVTTDATESEWHGFVCDHNAAGTRYVNPTIGGGNLGLGSAFILMADRALLFSPRVRNGWDNGVGLARFGLGSTNSQTNGSPTGVRVIDALTENCGCGNHQPQGEQAGAGVNLLTASGAIVIGCVDRYSRCGYVTDYAGGAGGALIGCESYNAQLSPNNYNGASVGGMAYYILGSDARLIGCAAWDPAGDALVFDGYSDGSHAIGFRSKGAGRRSLVLQGSNNVVSNSRFDLSSYGNQGVYNAIEVIGTGLNPDGSFGPARTLSLLDVVTTGSFHALDVLIKAGVGAAYGVDRGLILSKGAAGYNNACPTTWAQGAIINPADPVGSLQNSAGVEAMAMRLAALAAAYNS